MNQPHALLDIASKTADWNWQAAYEQTRRPADGGPDAAWLWSFIDELQCSSTEEWLAQLERIRDRFSHVLSYLGIRYFEYQLLRSSGMSAASDPQAMSSLPRHWMPAQSEPPDHQSDPVAREALRNPLPFDWASIAGRSRLTHRQQAICRFAASEGLGAPATVPIHQQNEIAALTIVPETQDCAVRADLLYLLGHYFHLNVRRPLIEVTLTVSARRRSLLSPRETQVLELLASGKVTNAVSALLGISSKSVEFHIDSAKRKLNVANRTHAVARAIMLGLLAPE